MAHYPVAAPPRAPWRSDADLAPAPNMDAHILLHNALIWVIGLPERTRAQLPIVAILRQSEIKSVRLRVQEPPSGRTLYDHVRYNNIFYIHPRLASAYETYWSTASLSLELREWMLRLYFLHEFYHIAQQVSSDHVESSDWIPQHFRRLDYYADAASIEACLSTVADAEQHAKLPLLCEAVARGSDVFSQIEGAPASERLDGLRLERQLVWWLQYARASQFSRDCAVALFDFDTLVSAEATQWLSADDAVNLCAEGAVSTPADIKPGLVLNVTVGALPHRHSVIGGYLRRIAAALFSSSPQDAIEAFRPFFSEHPHLLQRRPLARAHELIRRTRTYNYEEQRERISQRLRLVQSHDTNELVYITRLAEDHFTVDDSADALILLHTSAQKTIVAVRERDGMASPLLSYFEAMLEAAFLRLQHAWGLADIYYNRFQRCVVSGRLTMAEQAGEDLLTLGEKVVSSPYIRARAHRAIGEASLYRCKLLHAERHLSTALRVVSPAAPELSAEAQGIDHVAAAGSHLAFALCLLGRNRQARRCFATALIAARETRHAASVDMVRMFQSYAYFLLGMQHRGQRRRQYLNLSRAQAHAVRADAGVSALWSPIARFMRLFMNGLESSQWTELDTVRMTECLYQYEASGLRVGTPLRKIMMAVVYRARESQSLADTMLREAREAIIDNDEHAWMPLLLVAEVSLRPRSARVTTDEALRVAAILYPDYGLLREFELP
jgi:tetratricopeptide (TPR) repeat protein